MSRLAPDHMPNRTLHEHGQDMIRQEGTALMSPQWKVIAAEHHC